ncbi:MAG: phosphoenolpyruvate--protein phosphotransferase [Treponema sp.]|nr:phosphoenolpyruvate--protein phosphotransferase [Treponema sp.]
MVLNGKGAAPGAAVGGIFIYNEKFHIPSEAVVPSGEEQVHLDRYKLIKNQVLNELDEIKLSVQKIDPGKASIFEAHKEIADDIIINEEIPAKILKEKWAGDWAIYQVYETVMSVLRKTNDPLIAERAVDFDDVRARLLRLWYLKSDTNNDNSISDDSKKQNLSNLKEPVIIAAVDLKPSDTACLDREKVLAILTEQGGLTSHTAIIAKSYGIPAILGIKGLLENVKQGQLAAVDAQKGTVYLDPKDDVIEELIKKSDTFRNDKMNAEHFKLNEGCTLCGEKIEIGLNVSNNNDEEINAQEFTDFAGLFRTEFLFMGRNKLPAEEEQFNSYKKVLECFGKKPVVIRLLDIGGDKQLASLEQKKEDNPFLGNRGLRFCFSNPDIFKTQIRACLRASVYGNLWLMLPMVGSLDDIKKAKEIIKDVKNTLLNEGEKIGEYKFGIMIEIPSIALIIDKIIEEIDFASIGSNDLCQYLCAADRMNSSVENYYQQYHPAMFRIIKDAVNVFIKEGKSVSICGELGSDPAAIPVLIGLGMRKLSMGAASVASVKRTIAGLTVEKALKTAENVLALSTAGEIEEYLHERQ